MALGIQFGRQRMRRRGRVLYGFGDEQTEANTSRMTDFQPPTNVIPTAAVYYPAEQAVTIAPSPISNDSELTKWAGRAALGFGLFMIYKSLSSR